ncbi:MAG: hypothetical protein ACRYFU_02270 [Janthinobacterium lividum]
MKRLTLFSALAGMGLLCSVPGMAQEKGTWRAASTTAKGVTGDLFFSNQKLTINFGGGYTIAQIRTLEPAEANALFNLDSSAGGSGNVYRTSIPAEKKFLHKNTLCGSEETQWVITYVVGHELQLAFFSGPAIPVMTPDAVANATNLCGSYSYVR